MPDLSLDDIERPERPDPMTITVGGKSYTLADMVDLDHRVITEAQRNIVEHGDARAMVRAIVKEDDHEDFFANKLPGYKIDALADAYQKHYRVKPGEVSAS